VYSLPTGLDRSVELGYAAAMRLAIVGSGCTLLTAVLAVGCASSPRPVKNAGLRASAAADLNCDEARLKSEELSPRSLRVSGCGRSALYSCEQSGLSDTPVGSERNVPEHEARNSQPTGVGHCSWVRSH
jgi:hypothetical protein